MIKESLIIRPLLILAFMFTSVFSVTAASPSTSTSPTMQQFVPSSFLPELTTIPTGLLGCVGVKDGQLDAWGDNNWSSEVFVRWTITHNWPNDFFQISVKDEVVGSNDQYINENFSASNNELTNPYALPIQRYVIMDSESTMTIKLSVQANTYQADVDTSVVNCQLTVENDFGPPPQTQLNSFSQFLSPFSSGTTTDVDSDVNIENDPANDLNTGIRQLESAGSGSSGSGSSSSGTSSSGTSSSDTSSSGTSSSGSSGSSSGTQTTGGQTSTETSGGTSSATGTEAAAALYPSPDILICKGPIKTLYYENDEPAYDRMGVNCSLLLSAIVSAKVYTDAYDPKAEDNSAAEVKTILFDTTKEKGGFGLSWDGYDDYDQGTPLAEYKFVVEAKPSQNFSPDISIHTFKAENVPEGFFDEKDEGEGEGESTADSAASDSESANAGDGLHGSAPEKDIILSDDDIANTTLQDREASKCPTVFYPVDIEDSPYKILIRKAYDECLVKGYADGTFRAEQGLTRAEATKIAVLASGGIAWQGCYDADCGTPFNDLVMWQGPWVKAAYENGAVKGVASDRFDPNRNIPRAEAVALMNKTFGIPQHLGCYDPDCGAGFPDDPFTDIIHMWQGPYLRAAADRSIIQTVTPGRFYPDSPIARGQFVEMVFRAQGAK